MGQRDFHPLSANFLLSKWLLHTGRTTPRQGPGRQTAERKDCASPLHFVADDDKTAAAYARTEREQPYRFYYSQLHAKLTRSKRLFVFKNDRNQPDDEVTHDFIMDELVIHGSVNKGRR